MSGYTITASRAAPSSSDHMTAERRPRPCWHEPRVSGEKVRDVRGVIRGGAEVQGDADHDRGRYEGTSQTSTPQTVWEPDVSMPLDFAYITSGAKTLGLRGFLVEGAKDPQVDQVLRKRMWP